MALVGLCGGCGVGVRVWGCGPVVLPCVRALLAAVVVHEWVACVVGLAPTLGVGCWADVNVCGACCGYPPPLLLWCAALLCSAPLCAALRCPCTRVLLWCVLRCAASLCASASSVCLGVALCCATLLCGSVPLCASVGSSVPHYGVCCATSTRNGSHGYTGHGHTLLRGPSPGNLRGLGCRHPTVGGAGSKHPGPTNVTCTQLSYVRLCQLCVPWRGSVLCCSGVCCAALFCCAPLSALACRAALCATLCAVLHQQRMAATATRATATLFHGGQVPAISEALRCHHTPVGGAVSKHPGQPMRIVRISHLISSHVLASVGSMGLGVAPPCVALMCVALHRTMRLSVTPLYHALYCCARCVSCRCMRCCFAVRRCQPHVLVCCGALYCSVLACSLSSLAAVRALSVAPRCLVLLPPSTPPGGGVTRARRSVGNGLPGCETRMFSPSRSPSMCTTGCHSLCVQHTPCGWLLHCGVYTPTATMRTRTTSMVSPGHMKYHTSPLVLLGIGVWGARTILMYCASMKSTVTYAKRCRIVSVFGSPSLLPSCSGPCVAAPLLPWRTSRCWRLSPLRMSASCRLRASVSNSPSLALPICLKSPSAFSLWCAFLSGCTLTLSCLYARLISSVMAPGYRTHST